MSAPLNWPRNRLLLALPSPDLNRLMPELEQIQCHRGQVLMDADRPLDHISSRTAASSRWWRFMRTAVPLRWRRWAGRAAQAFRPSLEPNPPPPGSRQIPGSAARISRAAFTNAIARCRNSEIMHAYVQAFLEQVLVSVACNGAHNLKERLARWLLMMRDRGGDDDACGSRRAFSPKCSAFSGRPSPNASRNWNGRA